MTLFDMTKNIDSVIAALVHHSLDQAQISSTTDISTIKQETYKIISDTEKIKKDIYPD